MTVTVTPTPTVSSAVITYPNGTQLDVEAEALWVYASPDEPVAVWARGQWMNGAIS